MVSLLLFIVPLAASSAPGAEDIPCAISGPASAQAFNERGKAYAAAGDWPHSRRCFQQAYQHVRGPPPGDLCNNYALAVLKDGDARLSAETSRDCLRQAANDTLRSAAWFNLGLATRDAGPFVGALLARPSKAARTQLCATRPLELAVFTDAQAASAQAEQVRPQALLVEDPAFGVLLLPPSQAGCVVESKAWAGAHTLLVVTLSCQVDGSHGGTSSKESWLLRGPPWKAVARLDTGYGEWGDGDGSPPEEATPGDSSYVGCDAAPRQLSLEKSVLVVQGGVATANVGGEVVGPVARAAAAECDRLVIPRGRVDLACLLTDR